MGALPEIDEMAARLRALNDERLAAGLYKAPPQPPTETEESES